MAVTINGTTGLTGVAAIDNVSSTELGYVDGVTSAIQTQINGKAAVGTWTSYTPTWTGITVGNGTVTGQYCIYAPNLVSVYASITFGSTTSITGSVSVGLPVGFASPQIGIASAGFLDSGTAGYRGWAGPIPGIADINTIAALSSTASIVGLSSTVPFTWAVNDIIEYRAIYRAA